MPAPRVIILNGPGSVGKSATARALQTITAEPFLHVAMDAFIDMLPRTMFGHPDGLFFETIWDQDRPSVSIKTGPFLRRAMQGMRHAVAAMAVQGIDLVVDEVMLGADTQLSRLRELDQRIGVRFAIATDSQRCGMSGKSPVSSSEEQRSGLAVLAGSRDRGEADRARAILLTLSGWTSSHIAEAFGVREDTVRLWRGDFSRDGVAALKASIAPGPAPVKTETALRVVTPLLEEPVANRPNWTIARMRAEIAAREGVCISRSQLSKALRKKSSVTGGRGTP